MTAADVVSGGTFSPGDAVRGDNWLQVGTLSLGAADTQLNFELGAPDDGGLSQLTNDLIIAPSLPLLRGVLNVSPLPGFASAPGGSKWRLFDLVAGSVPASHELTLGAGVSSDYYIEAIPGDSAVYLVLVPEAATSGMVLLGLVVLNRFTRRGRT